jgi:hypothetical protein
LSRSNPAFFRRPGMAAGPKPVLRPLPIAALPERVESRFVSWEYGYSG